MLKTIDPLLTPELLFVLAAIRHGDGIAVVDANFPADSVADSTCHGRVVSLPGASMPEVVDASLSVLPLDESVEASVRTMATTTDGLAEVQKEVQAIIDADAGRHRPMGVVERTAFYEEVASQIRCKQPRVKAPFACYAAELTSSSAWLLSSLSENS